ncbi:MAG: DUF4160 domain-containing protein [Anaeroplasmataceae bacterium]|nr:DUF4160 domain-containing protein [Anaeroplasmataceae bacterium]
MPVLSRFYGIIIRMYFQQAEHNPPHLHAIYNEYIAVISLIDFTVIEGELPSKALTLVLEWMKLHKEDLLEIWETQIFKQLDPLK